MKGLGWCLLMVGIFCLVIDIIMGVSYSYHYDREIGSYWELADKSSTLQAKSDYMNKFVEAIEKNIDIEDYNAVFLKTPTNSVKKNLDALKTLQTRLKEIQKIDITSFAYQQAIQQITAQEQGEAKDMISVFEDVYAKNHYPLVWDWWAAIFCIFYAIICILGVCILSKEY